MLNDRLGLLDGLFAPGALDELERQARQMFGTAFTAPAATQPRLDVWTNEHEARVVVELPGIDPAAVEITVEDRTLTLRGAYPEPSGETPSTAERPRGPFQRAVKLPHRVDADRTQATYRDGLLEIRLPRAEGDKPRKIDITGKTT